MTEQSIKRNLKLYFGHKTLFLDARLYFILAEGKTNRRIYMDVFINKFYKPLFEEPQIIGA
jgi:hypothetical protein